MDKTRKPQVTISIRDFALPSPLSGSIEVNSGYAQIFGGPEKMAGEGRIEHSRIQKERQKLYPAFKAEHKLAHKFEGERYIFSVSGRADGFIDGVTPVLEEIKTTVNAGELLARLAKPDSLDHPYRLQLATYAYIVYLERGVAPVTRFLVLGTTDRQYQELTVPFEPEAYQSWLARRLDELDKQVAVEAASRERRKALVSRLVFPFARPRPGQKELIDELARDIESRQEVLIQAPTGLGKTAAVIFPLLRDALARGQKLVYVTPKNSQHAGAQDAIDNLRNSGCRVKSMTLNAKARMCLKDEVICNPGYCEYARDYYDKLARHKLVDKMGRMKRLTQDEFRKLGYKYEVCPFELSLEAVAQSDVVVADYNYVFSPRNTLGRFTYTLSKDVEKPNLVVDEAHNLPQRSCDYYSKGLSSNQIVTVASDLSSLNQTEQLELRAALSEILFSISNVGRVTGQKDSKVTLAPAMFEQALAKLTQVMIKRLSARESPKPGNVSQPSLFDQPSTTSSTPPPPVSGKRAVDPILALYNYVSEFKDALEYEGDEFLHLYSRVRKPDMSYDETLKVVCCDASSRLKLAHREFAHIAAFSATIKPFQYFAQLCGFAEDVSCREYSSPFPREKRKILVIPQVSTKYADRERNYDKIAQAVVRLTAVKPGNYFVFFPSFAFLEAVYARVKKLDPQAVKLVKQENEASPARAREIIEELKLVHTPTLVFAVQGGVLAEGVDYPGEMIIGAIIVGPGLPSYNFEREKIREYYEKRYGKGFDYAYIYPAMAKVVQAAGRVIRSDSDSGLIVLMDKRFTQPSYTGSMPVDWAPGGVNDLISRSLIKDVEDFWQSLSVVAR